METLFKEFGITNYKIKLHVHEGGHRDKDIILEPENIREFPEIIKFIQDKFYKVGVWNLAAPK